MATFSDDEKTQLWRLFSNDTNDLDAGSSFLTAISDFEAEDLEHPTYNLVSSVQDDLATIADLECSVSTAQSSGVVASESFDDQYSATYVAGGNGLQGDISKKSTLIEGIRERMQFNRYIGDRSTSRVLGPLPMRTYYGLGYR